MTHGLPLRALATILLTAACAHPRMTGTDCHMHIHPGEEGVPYDGARVLSALEGAGLERACILSQGYQEPSGCQPPGCPSQRAWTEERNDWTLEQAKQSPNLIPFCGVPISAPWSREEAARCASKGARGLKLHPNSEGLSLVDPEVYRNLLGLSQTAAEHGMPILIHIPFKDPEVDAFFRLAAERPKTTFIAAHQLGPRFKRLVEAPRNVYFDISGLPLAPRTAAAGFVAVWRAAGMDRILLGSDWPLLHPSEHMAALRAFPLTREERRMIITENARRLFPR